MTIIYTNNGPTLVSLDLEFSSQILAGHNAKYHLNSSIIIKFAVENKYLFILFQI